MTTRLRGITWDHPRGLDSVVAAADRYADVRPEVAIEWSVRSLQAFADQSVEELAAEYDLLVVDHPHIPHSAVNGALAALDGRGYDDQLAAVAARSVGPSHETYHYDGHQWGLATDAAAQVAVCRPDLLPGPPASWAEVLELAKGGRVVWAYKPVDAFSSLVTIAGVHGAAAMTVPEVFLRPEAAAPALEIMHRLAELVPASNAYYNPIDVAEDLASSDTWVYSPLAFGYTNYSRARFRSRRLRYIDMPAGPAGGSGSLLGGAGIAVSASSHSLEESIRFAFWLDSSEVQRGAYYDGGGQPGHADAWDDDRLNEDTLDFFRGTRATLEGAYVRPRHPGYMAVQDEGSPLVTRALLGEISDEQLLRELDELVARHLGEE